MRENLNFGFFGKEEHVMSMSYKTLDQKGTIQFQQSKCFLYFFADFKRFFLVNSIKSKFSLFSLFLFTY